VSGKQVLVVYDRRDFGVVNKVEPVEKESREGFFFVSAQDLYFIVSELAMGELGVVGTVFVILVFVILKVS
jgi:hypothetical protein